MKLIALHVARLDGDRVVFMSSKSDVSSFGYLERKAVRELGNFLAREIFPKVQVNQRDLITHKDYLFLVLRWSDGLAVSAFTDKEYPSRVAYQLLSRIHDDFREKIPRQIWQRVTEDHAVEYKDSLRQWLKQYQNPREFDAVTRTQHKVDETKEILQRDIEQVLGNHAQIMELLERSEDISAQSELMFKAAKKSNKGCCRLQ